MSQILFTIYERYIHRGGLASKSIQERMFKHMALLDDVSGVIETSANSNVAVGFSL